MLGSPGGGVKRYVSGRSGDSSLGVGKGLESEFDVTVCQEPFALATDYAGPINRGALSTYSLPLRGSHWKSFHKPLTLHPIWWWWGGWAVGKTTMKPGSALRLSCSWLGGVAPWSGHPHAHFSGIPERPLGSHHRLGTSSASFTAGGPEPRAPAEDGRGPPVFAGLGRSQPVPTT